MKRWLMALMFLMIIAQSASIYFLNKENQELSSESQQLTKIITKPSVPNALYIFGCKQPSAAVLVFSNGKSYPMERAQLMKLKGRLPKGISIIPYQHPDCRPSGT